jgi:hypothetical protein
MERRTNSSSRFSVLNTHFTTSATMSHTTCPTTVMKASNTNRTISMNMDSIMTHRRSGTPGDRLGLTGV